MRLKKFSVRPRLSVRKDQNILISKCEMDAHKLFFWKKKQIQYNVIKKQFTYNVIKKICNTAESS